VEGLPLLLQMFHTAPLVMLKPHWHAQVEVNFIVRGSVHYRMNEHEISLSAGEMCLFWGGLPHQMDDLSDDAVYAGAHLPLVHFFRLHLPADVRHRLMTGATLVTGATDQSDNDNFARWNRYARSGDPAKAEHAVNELLLRLERVRFEPYRLVPETAAGQEAGSPFDQQSSRNVGRMCDFIAENFLYDIDCVNIAAAADIHPKYAMSLFKKSTGMTLNEYVNLLRLSYAQALLMHQDANVLRVAMDSGFGSLSAFNKSFRKLAGMTPSDFRRGLPSAR
jgi:AraC-like DNA-binding protein